MHECVISFKVFGLNESVIGLFGLIHLHLHKYLLHFRVHTNHKGLAVLHWHCDVTVDVIEVYCSEI